MYSVLIIDDDKTVRYMLKRFKKWDSYGFVIKDEACDGKEALKKLKGQDFDLIISDIKMPGMDGIEFLNELRITKYDTCVIFLSTHSDFQYAKQGIRLGVFDYLTKPVNDPTLGEALERVKTYLDEKRLFEMAVEDERSNLAESLKIYYPRNEVKRLMALILSGSSEAVQVAESVTAEMRGILEGDVFKIKRILESILFELQEGMGREFTWLERFEDMDDGISLGQEQLLSGIESKFLDYVNKLLRIIRKYQLHQTDSIVRRTCEFVLSHVEEDIKLDILAGELHINKDYIGKSFKLKTGCNFSDFVTKVKMEHAKHLLKTGDYKNYEISEKLGYRKPDYFTSLFKSYTGYTPMEYRRCTHQNA